MVNSVLKVVNVLIKIETQSGTIVKGINELLNNGVLRFPTTKVGTL